MSNFISDCSLKEDLETPDHVLQAEFDIVSKSCCRHQQFWCWWMQYKLCRHEWKPAVNCTAGYQTPKLRKIIFNKQLSSSLTQQVTSTLQPEQTGAMLLSQCFLLICKQMSYQREQCMPILKEKKKSTIQKPHLVYQNNSSIPEQHYKARSVFTC